MSIIIFTQCIKSHNCDKLPADARPGSLSGGAQLPEYAEQLVDLRVAREERLPIHLPSISSINSHVRSLKDYHLHKDAAQTPCVNCSSVELRTKKDLWCPICKNSE